MDTGDPETFPGGVCRNNRGTPASCALAAIAALRLHRAVANSALHLDLDGAWSRDAVGGAEYLDARAWGPRLRFSAPRAEMEKFYDEVQPRLAPFTLYGSGEFHHLSALWLRQFREPLVLVSFDNHPDWDVRPPHWGCGGWVNRALELPHVRSATVWGCGNFEFNWPHRWFANHRALRNGTLAVRVWRERMSERVRERWPVISRDGWRVQFAEFAAKLCGKNVYVTIDTDCLRLEDAVTNWEQGLFTAENVADALKLLRAGGAQIVGGDVCGAWSQPEYARWKQKFAANFDRPKLPPIDPAQAREINHRSLAILWPALTGAT